jgi:hypothetical protein
VQHSRWKRLNLSSPNLPMAISHSMFNLRIFVKVVIFFMNKKEISKYNTNIDLSLMLILIIRITHEVIRYILV